jgi:hypothetical protein
MLTPIPVKCACPGCNCAIDEHLRSERNGELFCSEACANRHSDGDSCPSPTCHCEANVDMHAKPDSINR